jgi:hypothetical protein
MGDTFMRKRITGHIEEPALAAHPYWLPVEAISEVEVTSEEAAYPIESALLPNQGAGWRASEGGKQTIRLHFNNPQAVHRIWMSFVEAANERTQECVLRWSGDGGLSFSDIVRQQWNFSPPGTISETEDYRVELPAVTVLELSIIPDISGGKSPASLAELRLA